MQEVDPEMPLGVAIGQVVQTIIERIEKIPESMAHDGKTIRIAYTQAKEGASDDEPSTGNTEDTADKPIIVGATTPEGPAKSTGDLNSFMNIREEIQRLAKRIEHVKPFVELIDRSVKESMQKIKNNGAQFTETIRKMVGTSDEKSADFHYPETDVGDALDDDSVVIVKRNVAEAADRNSIEIEVDSLPDKKENDAEPDLQMCAAGLLDAIGGWGLYEGERVGAHHKRTHVEIGEFDLEKADEVNERVRRAAENENASDDLRLTYELVGDHKKVEEEHAVKKESLDLSWDSLEVFH